MPRRSDRPRLRSTKTYICPECEHEERGSGVFDTAFGTLELDAHPARARIECPECETSLLTP